MLNSYKQAAKKFLAEGDTKKAIQELILNCNLLSEFNNDILLLSSRYNSWEHDYYIKQIITEKTELNKINHALLLILDRIESNNDLENKSINSSNPFKTLEFNCIYDSNKDINPKVDWTFFHSFGLDRYPDPIKIENKSNEQIFKLKAYGKEDLGINKPINRLIGFIELDYMAVKSLNKNICNLQFHFIPMKHNSIGQTGYIEVGSDRQDHSDNPFSPLRKRFIVPNQHIGDNVWHRLSIEFDFRYIDEAFYTIFAPRINEGLDEKGIGEIWFKNIKIFG